MSPVHDISADSSLGLTAKLDSKLCLDLASEALELLKGRKVILDPGTAKALDWQGPTTSLEAMKVAALITIGGDGTLLRTLCYAHSPLLAVNGGQVGFLTELGPKEMRGGIERFLDGEYQIETVQRLAPRLNDLELELAANEVLVHTAQLAKMLHLEVMVGDEQAVRYRADGLILATPTGSTSYSMSAGGPILHPRVEGTVVVPIAPFTLSSRPLVVPARTKLQVRLLSDKGAQLVIDGHCQHEMGAGDLLTLEPGRIPGRIIRFRSRFYERLHSKLSGQP